MQPKKTQKDKLKAQQDYMNHFC